MKTVLLQITIDSWGPCKRWHLGPRIISEDEGSKLNLSYNSLGRDINIGPCIIYADGYQQWIFGDISTKIIQAKE